METRCIYLISNISDPDMPLTTFCFDPNSPMITNVTTFNETDSSTLLFSKIATSYDADVLWILTAGIIVYCMLLFVQNVKSKQYPRTRTTNSRNETQHKL